MNKVYYFYANPYQQESIRAAKKFADILAHQRILAPAWMKQHMPLAETSETLPENADCALVFGGDGTLLMLAPEAAQKGVPMLGVHTGKVGFLMQGHAEDAETLCAALLAKDYAVQEKPMLRVTAPGGEYLALNDVSITRGNHPGVMAIQVDADGEHLFTPHGDGVIVSTPLGSTAYTLASGGPIVHPDAKALIVTPVSARELLSRPVVLPDTACVTLSVPPLRRDCAQLSVDGQTLIPLCGESSVHVCLADEKALFIQLHKPLFFDTLRKKTALWNEL